MGRENERNPSTVYSVHLGKERDRCDGNGSQSLIQRGPAGRVVSQPIKGLGGEKEKDESREKMEISS